MIMANTGNADAHQSDNVPRSDAELTRQWLQDALASVFPEARLNALTSERIGEAFGFASEVYRCRWQEKSSLQSVVVKLWSTKSKAGMTELRFYDAFKDIGIRIPHCYYAAFNRKNHRAVLILEDLVDARQGDCLHQLDKQSAENLARMMGKLHGTWVRHPRLGELPWLPQPLSWDQENDWFISRRSEFLSRFDNHITGFARQILNRIELAPQVTNDRLRNVPVTLLHDDFHLDNIMLENGTEPVLLDWSNPVAGPGANNLIDLLVFMSPLDNLDTLVQQYLNAYNQASVHPQSEQDLNHQLGGALLHRFSRVTCGAARWFPTAKRGEQLIKDGVAYVSEAVTLWEKRDSELFAFLN